MNSSSLLMFVYDSNVYFYPTIMLYHSSIFLSLAVSGYSVIKLQSIGHWF